MSTEYHKIQTIFKRNPATKYKTLLDGQYSLPEFEYLKDNKWVFTEKVDGTNIRIIFDGENITFSGRTDRAQIPADLVNTLNDRFIPQVEKMRELFKGGGILYGEGYGAKIQKGGDNYRPDQDFVLFDVKVGEFWLRENDVISISESLGLDIVPIIGVGSLNKMIDITKMGFNSKWGNFRAEGIVARPATELKTRSGHRIITKLKCKDFAY